MKSINNFIGLALLSGALLTSCSDSFLQRDSLTESSSNTFWQTPDDEMCIRDSCNACFSVLKLGHTYRQIYNFLS